MIRTMTARDSGKRTAGSGVPLRQLAVGQWAKLCELGSRPVCHRLLDLGFVPGTRLRVVRRAPLGDPVEIEIRGTRLCLRAAQLRGLRVLPENTPDP